MGRMPPSVSFQRFIHLEVPDTHRRQPPGTHSVHRKVAAVNWVPSTCRHSEGSGLVHNYVHVYMHMSVHMHVYVQVYIYLCGCSYRDQMTQLVHCSSGAIHIFLRQGLSLPRNQPNSLGRLVAEPQGSILLPLFPRASALHTFYVINPGSGD